MLPTWMLLKLQTVLQMAYNKQAEKSQIIINATKGPDVNRGLRVKTKSTDFPWIFLLKLLKNRVK